MLGRGLIGSALVVLGGWALATLPASTRLPAGLVELRHSAHVLPAALAVVLLGLTLLALAWGDLLHLGHVAPDEGLVRRCALAWAAPLLVAPPLFSLDGWAYAAQGAVAARGLSPYDVGPAVLHGPLVQAVDPRWLDTPAPYGPIPLAYGAGLAHLTADPLLLVAGHRLLAAAGWLLLLHAVPRLARLTHAYRAPAIAVVVASPLLLVVGLGGLHNDLLMTGLAAEAVVVGAERHWAWGAALAGAAAAVKVPGAAACLAIALISLPAGASLAARCGRLAATGAVAVGVLLGLGVVTGLGVGWIHALTVPGSELTQLSPLRLLPGPARSVAQLVPVAVGIAVALRCPTGDARRALRGLAILLLAAVLLCSAVRLWYFLWPLPFLGAVPLGRWARLTVVAGSAALALVAPLTSEPGGDTAAYVLVPVLVTAALVAVATSRRVRDRVLVARPVGVAEPLPAVA